MKYLMSFLVLGFFFISGCQKKESITIQRLDEIKLYEPEIDPADFSTSTIITNQYFPLPAGKKYIYEGTSEEGEERVEEMRLDETINILGVECVVVNFKAFVEDELAGKPAQRCKI